VDIEDAFQGPYHLLLSEVAADSALFSTKDEVEKALTGHPANSRTERMIKKIAAVRMLMADGQIKSDDDVSSSLLNLPATGLVNAGERWVFLVRAEENAKQVEDDFKATNAKEAEEEKKDNRFDIFDDDEFNPYDFFAFPFRLVGMILEVLFNIILYPFKLLFSILF
jgi:hypothetical protein